MMKYKDYSTEDFLIDEDFKNWVLFPTEESNSYWNSLLETHPSLSEKISASREILLAIAPKLNKKPHSQEKKDQIFSKIVNGEKSISSKVSISTINYPVILKFAAVFLIALGLSAFFYFIQNNQVVEATLADEVTLIRKENPKGRSSTIKLPDGSTVKLASNSSLEYYSSFNGDKREIWLDGKAFLEVVENPEKPFYVYTEEIYTKVLGTSFTINSPKNGNHLQVVLVSGKVLVENTQGTVSEYLSPNQKLTLDKEKTVITKSPLDYDKDLAWKDGILVLDKESVFSLKQKIENWYGVEVLIQGIPDDHKFTGKFKNKSLEYVMDAIVYASDIEYNLENKILLLKAKKM